jgi:hypothetical protein
MALQVLIQQTGPLPISVTFQAPSDSPMYLSVNGSVWTETANQIIGMGVNLDGQEVGHARIWSNGAGTHRAVVPAYIPIKLTHGQHTVEIFPDTEQTTSDNNDFYTVVLHY